MATSEFGGRWSPGITLIVACLLIAAASVYVVAHGLLPSDGTTLDFTGEPPTAGLAVILWRSETGGLMTGDVVTAIDGRPLDDWIISAGWHTVTPASPQQVYSVVRGSQTINVPVRPERYEMLAAFGNNLTSELALVYLLGVSAVIFALRPHLAAAQALFLCCSSLVASSTVFFLGLQASDLRHGWLVALWLWSTVVLFGIAMGGLLHLSFVFPSVRPAIARRPTVAILAYLGAWLPYLGVLATAWPHATTAAARLSVLLRTTAVISAVYFPLVLWNSLLSYRQAELESERRQMRWLLWAVYVAEVPWLALNVIPGLFGRPAIMPPVLVGVLWCAIPTAVAVALLRERLFDIDVIIRRTLVYSVLTVALGLVYFGSVVVLQTAFSALAGQSQSILVTVLSTLAIAALFGPARQRVQTLIDHRFYRRKYNAELTLRAFGATLRDQVDLQQLCERLEVAVDQSMQPEHVSLWIRPTVEPAAPLERHAQ